MLVNALTLLFLGVADPYLGDGHHGARVVSTGEELGRAAPLAAEVLQGSNQVQLPPDAGFVAGDLVLFHRTTSSSLAAPSRDAGVFDLEETDLGYYEWNRLLSGGTGGAFRLEHTVEHLFPVSGSQLVLVHEFTDLTIADAGRLHPRPWDGTSGGILALLASGTLTLHGRIDASEAGSRGGAPIVDALGNDPSTFGCVDPDQPSPRGAFKGESFFSELYGPLASGFGRAITGGGGGNCHNAGGGGGGHAGPGGQGGTSWDSDGARDVGGRGGMSVLVPLQRLTFGGGGGAGEAHHDSANNGGSRGGGIVFVRANAIAGTGLFMANGASNPDVDDAAGGGGAGGTVHVASATTLSCGRAEARGGEGGINPCLCDGTSGGGGGGRVILQADQLSCPSEVSAGLGGHFTTDGGVAEFRLAEPTFTTLPQYAGAVTVLDAGVRPPYVEPVGNPLRSTPFVVGCGCTGAPVELALLLVLLGLRRSSFRGRAGVECRWSRRHVRFSSLRRVHRVP